MADQMKPRVSAPWVDGTLGGGVNGACHGFMGGVKANGKSVLQKPQVVPVFWGEFYASRPDIVAACVQLLDDLITGPFMNGLVEYGVAAGRVLTKVVIGSPAPSSCSNDQLPVQINEWLDSHVVTPVPQSWNDFLFYFVFPSPFTELTLTTGETGFGGYHSSYGNLTFGTVKTNNADQSSGLAFAQSVSAVVGHECAEASTDPASGGYFADNGDEICEIGDICEERDKFLYRGVWPIETYWSNWNRRCIRGDDLVSFRKFAQAAGIFIPTLLSMSTLGTPLISLSWMASRV